MLYVCLKWAAQRLLKVYGAMMRGRCLYSTHSFVIKYSRLSQKMHSTPPAPNLFKTFISRSENLLFSDAMSVSSESIYDSSSAVLFIILLFSLLNNPVIGKPLLGSQQEEEDDELPNFQSTDRYVLGLMEEYDIFN